MARSDIYRREQRSDITDQPKTEVPTGTAEGADNFYEAMPMAAQPNYREQTTIVRDANVDGAYGNRGLLLAERIVSYIVGVVEAILGLRLLLSLFSYLGVITTANSFARFVYEVTNPLVAPFASLFNASYSDPGAWTIAFAMLIYGMIGYAIVKLIQLGESRR